MSNGSRRVAGLGTKSVIASIVVIGIAASILVWLNRIVLDRQSASGDAEKMRRIYVALSIYEQSNDGAMPPDLRMVSRYLGGPADYVAANDPFTTGTQFPTDPALLNSGNSPSRVSYSYLPQWSMHGGLKVKSWAEEMTEDKVGLMAGYWYGDIDKIDLDGRLCSGPVNRLNMDGSVVSVSRVTKDRLTADDLFLRPAKR
jgi:hypothetical protein